MMETVIVVDIFGDWTKRKFNTIDLNSGSYIGKTTNDMRKYSWNFKMFFATQGYELKKVLKKLKLIA